MKNSSSKKEYQPGKIGGIVHFIATMYKLDEGQMRAQLAVNFPELKDRSHCANCGESMAIYKYKVTYLDVKMLCAMAGIITERMRKGISFTDANKVHMQREKLEYTLASRGNITSKLGLIAKVMKKGDNGARIHDRKSGWSITKRGYDFLRGEPVPKMVKVFHNKIQEHFEETTTMAEVLGGNVGNIKESESLRDIAGVFVEEYERPRLL